MNDAWSTQQHFAFAYVQWTTRPCSPRARCPARTFELAGPRVSSAQLAHSRALTARSAYSVRVYKLDSRNASLHIAGCAAVVMASSDFGDVPGYIARAAKQCASAALAVESFSKISFDGVDCIAFTDGPLHQREQVLVHAQHEHSTDACFLVLLTKDNDCSANGPLKVVLCGRLPLEKVRHPPCRCRPRCSCSATLQCTSSMVARLLAAVCNSRAPCARRSVPRQKHMIDCCSAQ